MTHKTPLTSRLREMLPLLLVLAGLLLGATLASATETEPRIERLEEVRVSLVKDPAILPYARVNEFLGQLQRVGEGLFRMDFSLQPRDRSKPASQPIKLALLSDERSLNIRPDAQGRFELPLLPQSEASSAELATNQPRGTLNMVARLQLTVKPEQLDMAMVRRIVAVSHRARSELLPWYARWLFPQVQGVRVCSAEPRWELEWREASTGPLVGVALAADPGDRDPEIPRDQPSRPCTTLTGQERWPDAARLLAPADATLSVRLAGRG